MEAADYATALVPPARGLMYWADGIGVAEIYRQIQAWHQQYGERWASSTLLRRLAETGTSLREAKPGRRM